MSGRCLGGNDLAGGGHYLLEPGVVVGVAGKDAVIDARLAALLAGPLDLEHLLVLEQTHDVDHRLGVVAEIADVLGAELVGFELHVATIAGDQG